MNNFAPDRPIGNLGSVDGWKKLPISECGERLVPIGAFSDYPQIETYAEYFGKKLKGALCTVFVREGVAKRLAKAATFLPRGHKLFVWDGYRPTAVQQALFDSHVKVLEGDGVPCDKAIVDAQRFVSIPSEDPTKPAPHLTGGAVDLTIINEERIQLQMGTPFDSNTPESATRFYEELTAGQFDDWKRRYMRNRRLLWNVMTAAGFSNYPEEWWHYDFGNQFHAARTGVIAIYGAAIFSGENNGWETMRRWREYGR